MDLRRDSPDDSTHHLSKKDKANPEAQTPVSGGIPYLPEAVMVEILAKLPVKSLLRFKCVSKSWLTLISCQQFIKTQRERNLSNNRIISTISYPRFDLKHCSVSSLMHGPPTDACSIDYPKKHPLRPVWVVGSCDGLICLVVNKKDLFLWNPSLRKSKKLPPVSVSVIAKQWFYGFGCNESDDDYKVVAILSESGNVGAYVSMVKSYSMKTHSWKRMEDFNGGVPRDKSAKFACGKLHWFTSGKQIQDVWDIVSLDLGSEVLGIVEQPNYGEGEFELGLGVLGDCICVLCNYEISSDLWVLKEYGVKESWTKVATVPNVDTSWNNWYSKPLFMLQNGEVLLVSGMQFVVYNPKDNSIRIPETSDLKYLKGADVYVESLVSPIAKGR